MVNKVEDVINDLMSVGVSEHDAIVLADCILARRSCSWVNTDEVTDKMLQDLRRLIQKRNYKISVSVDSIPTRSKFIWDVKYIP